MRRHVSSQIHPMRSIEPSYTALETILCHSDPIRGPPSVWQRLDLLYRNEKERVGRKLGAAPQHQQLKPLANSRMAEHPPRLPSNHQDSCTAAKSIPIARRPRHTILEWKKLQLSPYCQAQPFSKSVTCPSLPFNQFLIETTTSRPAPEEANTQKT